MWSKRHLSTKANKIQYATTKTVVYTKTGDAVLTTVTATIPGGVATYTKDGKVFVTTLPGKHILS